MRSPALPLLAALALIAVLAALARDWNNERITVLSAGDPSAGWFSFDPDSNYHARRLARAALAGGAVAETDDFLNHPQGARIPWPPYYTRVLATLVLPFAPERTDDPSAWSAVLERGVASVTWLFGVLTAVLAACASWALARGREHPRGGLAAAVAAGALFALHGASLHASAPGNGDHHAWAVLLMTVVFALLSDACRREALGSPSRGATRGTLAGLAAGLLVGSWVGGLIYVLIAQAALGWLVVRAGRERLAGLAALGLSFHLALAASIAPAVLSSPWKEASPWMVVNLSWFHLAQPLLGALVFAPMLLLRAEGPGLRRWPWIVLGSLALLGVLVAGTDLGLARGVREGFSWAGRSNEFMAYVAESQPLLWGQDGSFALFARQLGWAPLVLVPVWLVAARRAFVCGEHELLVWVVAAPVLLLQALLQRRFSDAVGPPMAVLIGWGLARSLDARALSKLRAWPAGACAGLGLAVGLVLCTPALARTVSRAAGGAYWARGPQPATYRAQRALYEWIAAHPLVPGTETGAPGEPPDGAARRGVLAAWYHGHGIEWAGDAPSVATNFGSYVGLEGYLSPWEFFLSEDEREAEAILAARDAGYVLVDGGLTDHLEVMLRLVRPEERGAFLADTPAGTRPTPRWYGTLGARLMLEGRAVDLAAQSASDSLDFLRLVHVSASPHLLPPSVPHLPPGAGLPPAGWIWERVPGAQVVARGEPGEELRLSIELDYPERERVLVWTRAAEVDGDGVARVRVPYATEEANGDGVARGPARWSLGPRAGTLAIEGRAVLDGTQVTVP